MEQSSSSINSILAISSKVISIDKIPEKVEFELDYKKRKIYVQQIHQKGPQIVNTMIASFTMFELGTILGWNALGLAEKSENSKYNSDWIGSWTAIDLILISPFVGGFLSSLLAGSCIRKLGRKNPFILTALLLFIGWVVVAVGSSFYHLFFGRFITGICGGIYAIEVCVYVGEIGHKKDIKSLTVIPYISFVIGLVFINSLGLIMESRWTAVICSILAILSIFILKKLPESPRFMILGKNYKGCDNVMMKLRGASIVKEVVKEIEETRLSISANENKIKDLGKSSWSELKSSQNMKLLIRICGLFSFHQLNGILFIQNFPNQMDSLLQIKNINSQIISMFVFFPQLLLLIPTTFIVLKSRYKKWLVTFQVLLGLACIGSGLTFMFFLERNKDHRGVWLILLMISVISSLYSIAIGPLSWAYLIQETPPHIRPQFTAVVMIIYWLQGIIALVNYHYFLEYASEDYIFYLSSIINFIGALFLLLIFPRRHKVKPPPVLDDDFDELPSGPSIIPTLGSYFQNIDSNLYTVHKSKSKQLLSKKAGKKYKFDISKTSIVHTGGYKKIERK